MALKKITALTLRNQIVNLTAGLNFSIKPPPIKPDATVATKSAPTSSQTAAPKPKAATPVAAAPPPKTLPTPKTTSTAHHKAGPAPTATRTVNKVNPAIPPLNTEPPTIIVKSEIKMRFVQFLRKNDQRPRLGVVSEDGTSLIELSNNSCVSNDMITFLNQSMSMQEVEMKLKNLLCESMTDQHILLPPIVNPGKIICIGLNYKDHCEEQNKEAPKEPMFFSKFTNTLVGPRGNVIAHKASNKIDWEVELAVVIGKEAKAVSKEKAMDYVFGYAIAQDISARDWQKERNGGQFLIGKSMDTFCPFGPAVVHKSLVKNVNDLCMITKINGVDKQNGNTSQMVFKIDDVISRLSQTITLKPGDIILTGTPKGVGMHRNPPEYLKPGDVIESEIQCLGKLINKVVEG